MAYKQADCQGDFCLVFGVVSFRCCYFGPRLCIIETVKVVCLELWRNLIVPYVIAEPCIGVKDKSCVAVCPVDCIHEAGDQLYIDPNECIDCGLCEPECPVDAIFMEDEVPDQWKSFIQLNADYAKK